MVVFGLGGLLDAFLALFFYDRCCSLFILMETKVKRQLSFFSLNSKASKLDCRDRIVSFKKITFHKVTQEITRCLFYLHHSSVK